MTSKHFFLHIPKCGGSTIRQYYREVFDDILFVQRGPRGDITSPAFVKAAGVLKHDAIVGHLSLIHFLSNTDVRSFTGDFIIHSVIRDPIDRLISFYNFVRFNKSHPEHKLYREMDGVDFVMASETNIQARYIGLETHFDTVDQAAHSINLVALEHSIEHMRDYFTTYLGKKVSTVERANITSERFVRKGERMLSRKDFTQDQMNDLRSAHATDLELYAASRKSGPLRCLVPHKMLK